MRVGGGGLGGYCGWMGRGQGSGLGVRVEGEVDAPLQTIATYVT